MLNRIMRPNQKQNPGFTLIETMVVIGIIVILMGIAVVSYQSANQRTRNGRRTADLEQLRSALEMYRVDCGQYPGTGSFSFGGILTGTAPSCSPAGQTYMAQVPNDPQNSGLSYTYYYISPSTTTYRLCAYIEGGSGTCTGSPSCGGGKTCNYQVTQP